MVPVPVQKHVHVPQVAAVERHVEVPQIQYVDKEPARPGFFWWNFMIALEKINEQQTTIFLEPYVLVAWDGFFW